MPKVELKMQSPLVIGGKRIKDNVIPSLDYIPGNFVRAAFAKQILLRCPLYVPGEKDKHGRYNYVGLRDGEKCKECELFRLCENFSNIGFSFFYPKGCDILPFTSRRCKTDPDIHQIRDVLIYGDRLKCSECKDKDKDKARGRMESAKGYIMGGKSFSVPHISFTRTAIDPYTGTSLDSSLYSINAVNCVMDGNSLVFEGEVWGDGAELISPIQTIMVGRYSSVGMGRMGIKVLGDEKRQRNNELAKGLESFNKKIREENIQYKDSPEDKTYIPMLFKSHAKLDFKGMEHPLDTEEYLERWGQAMFGQEQTQLKVERVYAEYDLYRGYDTSREWGKWEKPPEIRVLKGTVVLLSVQEPMDETVRSLACIEGEGIGGDRLNGFGRVEFCSTFHAKEESK
ncbi:CRISPR-associated Csx10 family RAMP protein [Anaerobacterium chartisolvens]|uniref:CRISPR-associated Csx10 family RAMP protein n=1 Tax=Anaerobacterium chartisolvens TaxID=1297424 RepID=A0A369AVU8_9FIRM|nr:hypothetical protein [Anaerobacterium chartisolvens]RCX13512.1 CRISPR-associated Csx10 family RAMP protein [Anaerobacterium chartisolvens]